MADCHVVDMESISDFSDVDSMADSMDVESILDISNQTQVSEE